MTRLLAAIGFACITTAAAAAPPIAYSTNGAGNVDEVWLINADGSGAVRVYRGTSKVAAVNLTVSPSGGKLAFIETDNIHYAIKVVAYDSAGVTQTVTTVPQPAGCSNHGLDLRADGLLLFSQSCNSSTNNNISAWDGSSVTTVIGSLQPSAAFLVRWLRDGSGFVWQDVTPNDIELRESSNNNPSASISLWTIPTASGSMLYMDIAHQSNALLASFGSVAKVQLYSFDSVSGVNATPSTLASGQDGHFSPDDSELIYRAQTPHGGYNLMVKTIATGATKTIATGIRFSAWGASN